MQLGPRGRGHFKWPMIVTAVCLPLAIAVGLGVVLSMDRTNVSPAELQERSKMLGQGLAIFICIVIGPFWVFAASKYGQERRAEQAETKRLAKKASRKSRR